VLGSLFTLKKTRWNGKEKGSGGRRESDGGTGEDKTRCLTKDED